MAVVGKVVVQILPDIIPSECVPAFFVLFKKIEKKLSKSMELKVGRFMMCHLNLLVMFSPKKHFWTLSNDILKY